MARSFSDPHQPVRAGTSTDYLLLLRCNDAAGANLACELGARGMTQTNSPGAAGSLFAETGLVTTGARTFNGSTQYAGRAAADGDESVFQSQKWGAALWLNTASLAATQVVLEYAEYSSPETEATNIQMQIAITTAGAVQFAWEKGAGVTGSTEVAQTADGVIVAGTTHHLGVSIEPDLNNLDCVTARVFIDGCLVYVESGMSPPTGGSSARWIVGASRNGGSAVGTPSFFFNGSIDDVVVTRWTPDVAWFRDLYARGIRDFLPRGDSNIVGFGRRMFSTFARVLVHVGTTAFAGLNKQDLEWVDLGDILGVDWVRGVEWGKSVDDLVETARIALHPRYHFFSMSPWVIASGAGNENPLQDGTTPLLRQMRRIRIETAVVPCGMTREFADPYFELAFDGFVREVDVTDQEVTVTAADLGIAYLDVWIEPAKDGTDRVYGSSGGTAIETAMQQVIDDHRPNVFDILSIDDSAGAAVIQVQSTTLTTDVNGRGRPHFALAGDAAKVTGTTNFNGTYALASVTDDALTTTSAGLGALAAETAGKVELPAALGYKSGHAEMLYVPTSPSVSIYETNEVASKGVLQALDDLVSGKNGWRCCFRWHELRQQFRLTLFDPAAGYTSSFLLTPVVELGRMAARSEDIRTGCVVEFASTTTDAVGDRTVLTRSAVNRLAGRDYGRRIGRVRAGSDTLINTGGEAAGLASRAVSDLAQPIVDMEPKTLFDPRPELGDEVTVHDEGLTDYLVPAFFNETVYGACVGYRHELRGDSHRTTVSMRNVSMSTLSSSVSRKERWAELMQRLGGVPGRGLSGPATPSAPTVTVLGTLNGNRTVLVAWTHPAGDRKNAWDITEVHISTSSSFTPSSSTLKRTARGDSAVITGLAAGTYYAIVVLRDRMKNRSAASAASASFTV